MRAIFRMQQRVGRVASIYIGTDHRVSLRHFGPSSLGKFSRLIHPRAVAQTLEKWGVVAGYAHRQPGLIMCKNVQVEEASLRR